FARPSTPVRAGSHFLLPPPPPASMYNVPDNQDRKSSLLMSERELPVSVIRFETARSRHRWYRDRHNAIIAYFKEQRVLVGDDNAIDLDDDLWPFLNREVHIDLRAKEKFTLNHL